MPDYRPPGGQSFRRLTIVERIVATIPGAGPVGRRLRRSLKPLFHRMLAHSTNLEAVLPGGERVVVLPAHRHMSWNREEYEAFRHVVRPGGVVLDVGANVGAYALLFGKWTGSLGRVYAFEPDPLAFQGLRSHLALNALDGRVTAVDRVVADHCGRARLAVFECPGISRVCQGQPPPGTGTIDALATSIDEFCAERAIHPDVIKVDVEGAELQVLRGARLTIAAARERLFLYVEMHPRLWAGMGHSAEDLRRECRAQRLVPERLNGAPADLEDVEGVCLRLRCERHVECES